MTGAYSRRNTRKVTLTGRQVFDTARVLTYPGALQGEWKKKSSGAPHLAPVLTVRCFGSQMVAFIEVPLARGAGAFGPQIGAIGPNWIGLPV